MGVRLLSSFLKYYCLDDINKIHLSKLSGKKICIDTSIYLYRFKAQERLLENFYLMCSLFRHYNIIPIFIFDGKPPAEKYEELKSRRQNRQKFREQYKNLLKNFGNQRTNIQNTMLNRLKRNFTTISKEDIQNVKNLFKAYGIKYIVANGEADVLCATLVLKNKVFAVLTEDMDLFVYGCSNILRYFSLANHNCVIYNLNKILKKLSMSMIDFQMLCVLSGTDYNKSKKNIFYYFKIYNNEIKDSEGNLMDWVNCNLDSDAINNINRILKIYQDVSTELNNYKYFIIKYDYVNYKNLHAILEKERFVFI